MPYQCSTVQYITKLGAKQLESMWGKLLCLDPLRLDQIRDPKDATSSELWYCAEAHGRLPWVEARERTLCHSHACLFVFLSSSVSYTQQGNQGNFINPSPTFACTSLHPSVSSLTSTLHSLLALLQREDGERGSAIFVAPALHSRASVCLLRLR